MTKSLEFIYRTMENLRVFFHHRGMTDKEFFSLLDFNGDASELVSHIKNRTNPKFFFDWREKEDYINILKELDQKLESSIISEADKICGHVFEFLGSDEIEFDEKIDWHHTLINNLRWPLKYSKNLDLRSPKRIADVKLTWELNRHQYFVILGKAYWYTGNEKYAKEFVDQIVDWIEKNPVELGVNWESSLEVAIRSISWIWAYHYFINSQHLGEEVQIKILKSLILHAKYIESNLSYGGRNHLIGEAAGLEFIGLTFPEFKDAKGWRKKGLEILYEEIEKQVYNDGGNVEKSIDYHRFVVDFYIQIIILLKINGVEVPRNILEKIKKMHEFLLYLTKPDGKIPLLGDSDDARVVKMNLLDLDDYRDCLNLGSVLFNMGFMKKVATNLDESVLWLLGVEGFEKYKSIVPNIPEYASKAFYDSGYFVLRTGWDKQDMYLLFNCAPFDVVASGHGHADSLHLELYAYGRPLLIDSGTYTYNGLKEWRDYFRGTDAHNTIVIDRQNQGIIGGTFKWDSFPNPSINEFISSKNFEFVDCSHDGYTRLSDPVIHRRKIFFVKPEYWVVYDLLTGSGKHTFDLLFHFHPTHQVELDNSNKVAKTLNSNETNIMIIPLNPESLDAEIIIGSTDPIQGWFSESYGHKVKAPCLEYKKISDLPTSFVTLLYPYIGEDAPKISVSKLDVLENGKAMNEIHATAFEIKIGDIIDYLMISQKSQEVKKTFGCFETDAEISYIRKNYNDKLIRGMIKSGSKLGESKKYIIDMNSPQSFFEIGQS